MMIIKLENIVEIRERERINYDYSNFKPRVKIEIINKKFQHNLKQCSSIQRGSSFLYIYNIDS